MPAIMQLKDLIESWKIDAKVDSTEPGKELLKIPNLHARYAEQLAYHSLAMKSKRAEYYSLKKVKIDYYNGRMDAAELAKRGWQPFALILKTDLNTYLDADPDLQDHLYRIALHEETIVFLGSVLKELNNRSFEIRGFCEWQKYLS